ncbi:MAG: hypothetical protein EOO90_10535 [Pedobacter sp.]|nr:MAG: hypothetical protein EOO90_10535 [Pedobacter sp.]
MSILVKQQYRYDCGLACMASVAANYKVRTTISKIRMLVKEKSNGTNMLDLSEAAKKIGFIAKAVRGVEHSLTKIPLPAIAHLTIDQHIHHYVVIYEIIDGHIILMDPAPGKLMRKSIKEFLIQWTGALLLIQPTT